MCGLMVICNICNVENPRSPFVKADTISLSSELGSIAGADSRRDSDAVQVPLPLRPLRPAPRLPVLSDQQHTSTIRRSAPPIPPRLVLSFPVQFLPQLS